MENNKLILVYYVGVKHIDDIDIPEYMEKLRNRIVIPGFDGHCIFVPMFSYDTKIECINPKYITEEELIEQHTSLMEELNKELQHHIEELKNNKENG